MTTFSAEPVTRGFEDHYLDFDDVAAIREASRARMSETVFTVINVVLLVGVSFALWVTCGAG